MSMQFSTCTFCEKFCCYLLQWITLHIKKLQIQSHDLAHCQVSLSYHDMQQITDVDSLLYILCVNGIKCKNNYYLVGPSCGSLSQLKKGKFFSSNMTFMSFFEAAFTNKCVSMNCFFCFFGAAFEGTMLST